MTIAFALLLGFFLSLKILAVAWAAKKTTPLRKQQIRGLLDGPHR